MTNAPPPTPGSGLRIGKPVARLWQIAALAVGLLSVGGTLAGERSTGAAAHAYQVVYRGVFSLDRDMPIADLELATAPAEGGLESMRLDASSAAYPVVESLYPIRYRFRTWVDEASGGMAGFESYEKTRKLRHRAYLRDGSAAGVRRLPSAVGIEQAVAALSTVSDDTAWRNDPLFDRLGLLHRLRNVALSAGDRYEFPVTNGRDHMDYRVRVERTDRLRVGASALPAYKLRVDAYERDNLGSEVAAHRPVFIWLSRDEDRIPLRVDVRHAVGLFRVQLKSLAEPSRLVRR